MQPEDIDALLDQANQLLEAGMPNESLRCLDGVESFALDVDERIEWGSLRAWALTELGRDDEAIETLDLLLEEFPRSPRLLGTLGVVLSNTNELEDARDALEEAVDLSPEDEVALANLALVYERLRDYDRAIEFYDRALDLGADIDWILQRRAATLSEIGQYAEAKITLKRYLSLRPEDAAQWVALAILHSDDEEYAQAFACYEQAESLEPHAAALRLNWGVTAVRAGRLSIAKTQLRQLQQLEPRSTRPWLLRAFILEDEGKTLAAKNIYDRILRYERFGDRGELAYSLEMAMDFFARHELTTRCRQLMRRAYQANACTVELCEAYRELLGEHVDEAYWFSVMVETDYRPGLSEVRDRIASPQQRFTRFSRAYQIVARNHDEALELVLDFTRRMGEENTAIREFAGEEPVKDTFTGIYEIETDSFVFSDENEP